MKFFYVAFAVLLISIQTWAAPPVYIWDSLIFDLLKKYSANNDITQLCPSLETCISTIQEDAYEIRQRDSISALLQKVLAKHHPELNQTQRKQRALGVSVWLHEKYGVIDAPVFAKLDPQSDGSYQTPGKLRFRYTKPALPSTFDTSEESSIQDLQGYITRKWGGLDKVAAPDRIIFSELGTRDTLQALSTQGYSEFYSVNAPYAMRGSKTLLAIPADQGPPSIVFHSFVGKDLLIHKLMQLAFQFGDDFSKVKVLTSNNLKSWEVADLVVTKALKTIPAIPIDDLVIGYTDQIEENLIRHGKFLSETKVGDFAEIRYYSITEKNGIERTVALLTHVVLRYFGKSVLTLVKPFLSRGIDRVIFAGSAGCLKPDVPLHSLVIPKTFHHLPDHMAPIPIDNELYNLLPFGESHAGKHISVQSPLVESQKLVQELREKHEILTVDVEGSKIAQLIAEHNQKHGSRIRFSAAFIVTDTPVSKGDIAKAGYGLHKPDFKGKNETKKKYASALNLLWAIPDRFNPSAHTRLLSVHYAKLIQEYVKQNNTVALAVLYTELRYRLDQARAHSANDLRVSFGIIKTYRDLLRSLDKLGVNAIDAEYFSALESLVPPAPLSKQLQRAIILQSLSRSSTINSGEVYYKGSGSKDGNRDLAIDGAEKVVDYILVRADRNLTAKDINQLHAILNAGILAPQHLGKIREFTYAPISGKPRTSTKVFRDFVSWLNKAPLTPESALEAFLRFEHFHPYADGNGRLAEIIAQHKMIQATGHPLLFPNRFDIDYIASLYRNGSFTGSNSNYLSDILDESQAFSRWLTEQTANSKIVSVEFEKTSGLLSIDLENGQTYLLKAFYRTASRIRLEREAREFLPETTDIAKQPLVLIDFELKSVSHHTIKRREYEQGLNLYRCDRILMAP